MASLVYIPQSIMGTESITSQTNRSFEEGRSCQTLKPHARPNKLSSNSNQQIFKWYFKTGRIFWWKQSTATLFEYNLCLGRSVLVCITHPVKESSTHSVILTDSAVAQKTVSQQTCPWLYWLYSQQATQELWGSERPLFSFFFYIHATYP